MQIHTHIYNFLLMSLIVAPMIIIALDNVDNDVLIILATVVLVLIVVPEVVQLWQQYCYCCSYAHTHTHSLSVDDIKRFWFALYLHIVNGGVVFGVAVVIMFILYSNGGGINTLYSWLTYIHWNMYVSMLCSASISFECCSSKLITHACWLICWLASEENCW